MPDKFPGVPEAALCGCRAYGMHIELPTIFPGRLLFISLVLHLHSTLWPFQVSIVSPDTYTPSSSMLLGHESLSITYLPLFTQRTHIFYKPVLELSLPHPPSRISLSLSFSPKAFWLEVNFVAHYCLLDYTH